LKRLLWEKCAVDVEVGTQGVAMAGTLERYPITEYEPKKIKMAITGNGNATKEQVAKMLQQLLGLRNYLKPR
jgi:crossover junction endodeoxyribonuclease RuvC